MHKEHLYLEIINNLCDGVYFVDSQRRITFWNKAAESITGYSAAEILGRSCNDNLLNHIDEQGRPLCLVGCPLFATILDGQQRKATVFLRHKAGHRIPILVTIFPMVEDGAVTGAIEIFTPASPVQYDDDLIEKLSNIAMRDTLTGLPNRRYLESFLEYKLNELKRFGASFAVLFADIDNFSSFNNTYGHETGDEILKNISTTIRKQLRKTDLFGRWGGEEFLGIYAINSIVDVPIISEKVRILVENTEVIHEGQALHATLSIGITIAHHKDTCASIVERADQLMYKSKANGKNRVTTD